MGETFLWLAILVVAFFGYFLPTYVASMRHRPNVGGIFIVNLLTGWLVIGWIIALVMACGTNPPRPVADDQDDRLEPVEMSPEERRAWRKYLAEIK